MPKGPRGEKRPADVIGNAVKVMRIATGEEAEPLVPKSPEAVARGKAGGKIGGQARQESLTPDQRGHLGRQGAAARWKDR